MFRNEKAYDASVYLGVMLLETIFGIFAVRPSTLLLNKGLTVVCVCCDLVRSITNTCLFKYTETFLAEAIPTSTHNL